MEKTAVSIEDKITVYFKKTDTRFKIVLLSAFIWGFIAHGMAFLNKYSMHDDTGLFDIGATLNSGRWFLGVLGKLVKYFFGGTHYSLPLMNGVFSIACIAFSSYLIVVLLQIKRPVACVAVCGILTTFPMLAGLFGYMFTAPYYMFAFLMSTVGVFILCRFPKWYTFVFGTILIACSIGTYQAFFPVSISCILLYFIQKVDSSENTGWKRFFLDGMYLAGSCVSALILYFAVTKLSLMFTHGRLIDYQGISSMGKEGLAEYLRRTGYAWKYFFNPTDLWNGRLNSMFPMRVLTLYRIVLLGSLILTAHKLVAAFKHCRAKAVQLLILVLLIPLATNSIFIMGNPDSVHTLMVYGQSLIFVYFAWLVDGLRLSKKRLAVWTYAGGMALLLLIGGMYSRYDNICYLKVEFMQQRAISYFTTLITQIKSTDGYRDEYPVVYINAEKISDETVHNLDGFSSIRALPVPDGTIELLNDNAWIAFMNNWCAFDPPYADPDQFADLPEVENMPSYPDQGSIRIIQDTVVVKF